MYKNLLKFFSDYPFLFHKLPQKGNLPQILKEALFQAEMAFSGSPSLDALAPLVLLTSASILKSNLVLLAILEVQPFFSNAAKFEQKPGLYIGHTLVVHLIFYTAKNCTISTIIALLLCNPECVRLPTFWSVIYCSNGTKVDGVEPWPLKLSGRRFQISTSVRPNTFQIDQPFF